MARVKRAVHSKKHRRAVLEQAQGYFGNKSRSYRAAHEQVMHSLQYAYRDRRARKGDFRQLWIQRINAAARMHGMSYSRLIAGLRRPASRSTARSWPIWRYATTPPSRALVEVAREALAGPVRPPSRPRPEQAQACRHAALSFPPRGGAAAAAARRAAQGPSGRRTLRGRGRQAARRRRCAAGAAIESVFLDPAAAPPRRKWRSPRPVRPSGSPACSSCSRACWPGPATPSPRSRSRPSSAPSTWTWPSSGPARPDLVVVCVDVRDPGNPGHRPAQRRRRRGARAWSAATDSVDLFNPKTVRARPGCCSTCRWWPAAIRSDVLDEVGRWGLQRWGTAARTGRDYTDADLTGPAALVLGNEAHGLSGSP